MWRLGAALRGEADQAPLGVGCQAIAQPIVHPVRSSLPELHGVGCHHPATPVIGPSDTVRVGLVEVVVTIEEFLTAFEFTTLVGGPPPEL